MAFSLDRSIISGQQMYLLGKILTNTFWQRLLGKNLVWKTAMVFFFFSFFVDFARFVFYKDHIPALKDPVMSIVVIFTFLAYIWIYRKYKFLVENRKNKSIGIKVVNVEFYLNLRFLTRWGFYTNISLLFLPISLYTAFDRILNNSEYYALFDLFETFVFIWITIPIFSLLYLENPEQTHYSRAKNKINSMFENKQRELVPLRVGA